MSETAAGHDPSQPLNQSGSEASAEHSSLAVVTGFLDAALRVWDDDHIRAKSQIRVAAALLHGFADDAAAAAKSPAAPYGAGGLAPWQARKVREFIEAGLESSIRLKDCASKARLSPNYFSRAFKLTFGTTVCHYIRQRRVERAQRLMLLSAQPLSQIALSCGFADQAQYCRVFRDVVGLSPNVWRRRHLVLAPGE